MHELLSSDLFRIIRSHNDANSGKPCHAAAITDQDGKCLGDVGEDLALSQTPTRIQSSEP